MPRGEAANEDDGEDGCAKAACIASKAEEDTGAAIVLHMVESFSGRRASGLGSALGGGRRS